MPIAVKICGLNDEASVQAVHDAQADYAGFVYFPRSPRHISFARAAELRKLLPSSIPAVSVLVDPDDASLVQMAQEFAPDYAQLHGKESPERLRVIRQQYPTLKLIKAIGVREVDDIAIATDYIDCADFLMFDAKAPKSALPGGNGISFDWALLQGKTFALPWFLSGGVNLKNIAHAVALSGAPMVDVSSGVERAPGVKDPALIHAFIETVRKIP